MKTLKFLAIFCLGAMLCACQGAGTESGSGSGTGTGSGSDSDNDKGLHLAVDKLFIYNNGGADADGIATFTVTFNGEDVTADSAIFLEEDPIDGNTYTSTAKPCSLRFWAQYGLEQTKSDIILNIVQTPPAAPAAPQDNNPTKTNFVRRVLLTQFTGTSCGFCPEMMNALYEVSNHAYTKNKFVLAAAHLFGTNDPAYLNDAKTLDKTMGVVGFPTVNADMWKNEGERSTNSVYDLIDAAYKRTTVKGGIAVNSTFYEEENYVIATCLIKAAEGTEFRVGAWLLEDNLTGNQANNGYSPLPGVNFNHHNNSIRLANKSFNVELNYTGVSVGRIEAGATKSHSFAFPLLKTWKTQDLRIVVFISTKEGDKWYVNNVISCPINGTTDFEYTE